MGVNDRIVKWMEMNRFTNKELAEWIESSSSAISQMKRNKFSLSVTSLGKLLEVHQKLNARWLLTGEGEMYNTGQGTCDCEAKEKIIIELERIIAAKDEIIKLLRKQLND